MPPCPVACHLRQIVEPPLCLSVFFCQVGRSSRWVLCGNCRTLGVCRLRRKPHSRHGSPRLAVQVAQVAGCVRATGPERRSEAVKRGRIVVAAGAGAAAANTGHVPDARSDSRGLRFTCRGSGAPRGWGSVAVSHRECPNAQAAQVGCPESEGVAASAGGHISMYPGPWG